MIPDVTVCVFAKPPWPGKAKTRLARTVGADGAARLAAAFLADTLRSVGGLPWARVILALAEPWADAPMQGDRVWLQGDGDLGQRLETVTARALQLRDPVLAIGADSPGLPADRLVAARARLQDSDAVLGPSEDGGFYLLGLRRCPPGLLKDLPWSASHTGVATRKRLHESGFRVTELEPWFDVDEWPELQKLVRLLEAGDVTAPETRAVLEELGLWPA
ncbi:MAG: TIGR04282 family arsenosugar biosynthesis glycosyltransferase [Deltaproteobacteria bacterium]|nr:TIGR04282 family arsenosugar biosynthesis glycosyltransferase [Deltaproteobacteria bacterium]